MEENKSIISVQQRKLISSVLPLTAVEMRDDGARGHPQVYQS